MNKNNIKFGTIIPLIGGSAMGCAESTGNKPEFHLSYNAFADNESHLEAYWPDVPMYRIDDPSKPIPIEDLKEVDYINSVCPCAGLSQLNTSRGGQYSRGSDALQNQWMYDSSSYILENIKPKVLWGENAPGLFSELGQGVVDKLKAIAEKYGYSFSLIKTNTELHGIPQRRIRTFYFFWNTPTVPLLNWKFKESKTLLEYLNEIPKDATLQDKFILEGPITKWFKPYQFILEKEGLTHPEFAKKIKKGSVNRYIVDNGLLDECIQWLRKYYPNSGYSMRENTRTFVDMFEHQKTKIAIGKGYWDRSPSFAGDATAALISKTQYSIVHPVEDRFLNIREMLHLMGLPHDFELVNINKVNHIVQNVPLTTAKDMADEVKKFCLGELQMTPYKFMKQDNIKRQVVEVEDANGSPKKFTVSPII